MKRATIGGQAVMEGVMMKSATSMCIAVRTDKGIRTEGRKLPPVSGAAKIPILRGVINFIQMLSLGVTCLTRSAEMIGLEDADDEPNKFEKWLSRVTGKSVEKIILAFAVLLSIALSVGLFILLPILIGEGLMSLFGSNSALLLNTIEGVVRIVIFLLYMFLVSRMKEIKRTFMYHGAEHKTIHCFEHEQPLTVENARAYTTLHPRCGTSFLLIVMIISILIFSVITALLPSIAGIWWLRTLVKLASLPIVAGVSYEVLRLLALHENPVTRVLRAPGLALQHLTTVEPTDDMLEVAIAAFEGVRALDGEPPCSDCPPAVYTEEDAPKADETPAETAASDETVPAPETEDISKAEL
ncbi:MAG: DUF1385 domain-containing protein [Eubacteriales bacterium]|nr:DUF1385 domain-containing protein [Eubacteriales bacterium]